ncbi:MAG: hypothetical protein RLY20_341 [Verrucomicrobiota bacterium]|jgi:ABC-type transport system involved in multi-copper enzyme maturation permease subunit
MLGAKLRFLTVAERELRVAARRKATHVLRWTTGLAFFVILLWLMWATDALQYKSRIHDAYFTFSVFVYFYCLLVGAIRTADCISSERREGTLGLLFLTNLNSLEIVVGKLLSNALPAVYGLFAIFPLLAMPILMGGVTLAEFGRTLLALVDAIVLALACGFSASVACKRQFPAVAAAVALALSLGAATLGIAAIAYECDVSNWFIQGTASLCPLYTISVADGGKVFQGSHYWFSLAVVAVLAVLMLANTTFRLAISWQDRASNARQAKESSALRSWLRARREAGRTALRRRLLDRNPFYWVTARQQISSPIFMLIVTALGLVTQFIVVPLLKSGFSSQTNGAILANLLGWLFCGLTFHVLTLYYAAHIAAQAVAEDKQSGALELIFTTPIRQKTIARGLWQAFRRRLFFPAIAVCFAHGYFLWFVMGMCLVDPPGRRAFPPDMTPWKLLWFTLLNLPIDGQRIEWGMVLGVRIIVLILLATFMLWFTLGWVGRWLGLRMKHAGFAPLVALALLVIPPVLVFSLLCFVADEAGVYRTGARIYVTATAFAAFGIAFAHCAILRGWAARRLRENFRDTVISNPDIRRRTWRDRGGSVLRFGGRAVGFATVCALLVFGYFGCQNYNSRRAWNNFQAELKRQNISLDVAGLLPAPVPDEQNFFQAPAFRDGVTKSNAPLRQLLDDMPVLEVLRTDPTLNDQTHPWVKVGRAPLLEFAAWTSVPDVTEEAATSPTGRKKSKRQPYGYVPPLQQVSPDYAGPTNNDAIAPLILKHLQRFDPSLDALAAAARRPFLRSNTNRTALAVLQWSQADMDAFTRLHFLFAIRALSRLETGQSNAACTDLLTCLRLTQLARQTPDVAAPARTHLLLGRSFQPLWEGLERHRWNDEHLAAIQTELDQFDLLADYTNAVQRTVRANIAIWKAIPDAKGKNAELPDATGGTRFSDEWRHVPRGWWLDNCIQLFQVGARVLRDTDPTTQRIEHRLDYNDLGELPIDDQSRDLLLMDMDYWNPDIHLLATAQTALNQARIAVALEQVRRQTGRYPKTLDALTPHPFVRIPCDPETGRPLLYELNKQGNYLLRGVGRDRKPAGTNAYSDDWLWAYPAHKRASTNQP